MIRVLIVDDQPLIRSALRALVDGVPDMSVVAEAEDGVAALRAARRHEPDVVVMDVRMPRMDGIEATRLLRAELPAVAVLVLTTFDLDEYVFRAVKAGAVGFLLKDGDAEELLRGIRLAVTGEALMAPQALRSLLDEFARVPGPSTEDVARVERLSNREREVLRHMADGSSNDEIAQALFVSVPTVKSHVSAVLAKLGARDRTAAVVTAYRAGLVPRC